VCIVYTRGIAEEQPLADAVITGTIRCQNFLSGMILFAGFIDFVSLVEIQS